MVSFPNLSVSMRIDQYHSLPLTSYVDTVDQILARFNDAGGFDELESVWFLIAHSTAAQNDLDPTIPRTPFDSTPSIMDGQFFIETQLRGTIFPGYDSNMPPSTRTDIFAANPEVFRVSRNLPSRASSVSCLTSRYVFGVEPT